MSSVSSTGLATVLLVTAIFLGADLARSADPAPDGIVEFSEALEASDLKLDLAVPESPAFTALGLNPENVTRPASPREFASSVLSGIDREGNFQVGLALDTVPYMLIRGEYITLRDYQDAYWRQLLGRTQLSIATTKGTSNDDESVRLGLGFRATPWTRGDPRLQKGLIECMLKVTIPEPGPGESMDDLFASEEAAAKKAEQQAERCNAEWDKRLAKASAWDIGASPSWIQKKGTSDDVTWGGGTLWTSFAYGFEDLVSRPKPAPPSEAEAEPGTASGSASAPDSATEGESGSELYSAPADNPWPQLILHARGRIDEKIARDGATNGFTTQDSLFLGARLRFGGSRLTVSAEAAYLYENPDSASSDSSLVAGLSSDLKLYDQVWLQVALGGSVGRSDDRIFVGGSLRWGGQSVDLTSILGAAKVAGAVAH